MEMNWGQTYKIQLTKRVFLLANLNQLMQNINISYTVFVNRKHQRSGHLFQGRFKSILVDKESYLMELCTAPSFLGS